jgi:hypothetical protein
MRTLATLMASITVLTCALFVHALAAADRGTQPLVVHSASR